MDEKPEIETPGRVLLCELSAAFLIAFLLRVLSVPLSYADLDSYGAMIMAEEMRRSFTDGTFSFSLSCWGAFFGIDHWPFLYSLTCALLSLTGAALENCALAVSSIAGSLLAPLGYLLAIRLWRRRNVARLGALLIIFSPALIWHSVALRNFSLYFLLYLLGVYLTVRAFDSNRTLTHILAALAWGCAYLTRVEGLAGLAVAAVIILLAAFKERAPSRFVNCAVMLVCAFLVIFPYLTLLHHVTGKWVLSLRYVDRAHFERKVFYETGLRRTGDAFMRDDDENVSRDLVPGRILKSFPLAVDAALGNGGPTLLVLTALALFRRDARRLFLLFLLPTAVCALLPETYQSFKYYSVAVPIAAIYGAFGFFSLLESGKAVVRKSPWGAFALWSLLFSSWSFGSLMLIEGPQGAALIGEGAGFGSPVPPDQEIFLLTLAGGVQSLLLASHLIWRTKSSLAFTGLISLYFIIMEMRGGFGLSAALRGPFPPAECYLPFMLFITLVACTLLFFESFSVLSSKLGDPLRFSRGMLVLCMGWLFFMSAQNFVVRALVADAHLVQPKFTRAARLLQGRVHRGERIVCFNPMNAFIAGGRWVKPPARLDEAFLRLHDIRYVMFDTFAKGDTAEYRKTLQDLARKGTLSLIHTWVGRASRFWAGVIAARIYEVRPVDHSASRKR
jgi:hypothetical protein